MGLFNVLLLNCVHRSTSDLLRKKPAASTQKPPDFEYSLKVKKQELETNACQHEVVERCLKLLVDHFECYRFSVGYPELIHPATTVLKSFAKKTRVARWKAMIGETLAKLNEWKQVLQTHRSKATFGPSNVSRLAAFSSGKDVKYT